MSACTLAGLSYWKQLYLKVWLSFTVEWGLCLGVSVMSLTPRRAHRSSPLRESKPPELRWGSSLLGLDLAPRANPHFMVLPLHRGLQGGAQGWAGRCH